MLYTNTWQSCFVKSNLVKLEEGLVETMRGLLIGVALPFIAVCIASIALSKEHQSTLNRSKWWFENTGFSPREPFSTLSNVVHIFSATWLTTKAVPERAVLFGIAAYALTMIGATSFLFHFDGARLKTSFHFGDLVSIVTFGFLLSGASLVELARVIAPPQIKKGIVFLQVLLPLSAAFAGYNLFSGWRIEKAAFYSHGVFVVLGVTGGMVKRNVFVRRKPKIDRRALLLVILDYVTPIIALGTAFKLNKTTWDFRRDAYAEAETNPISTACTPNGYEYYRPYLGGCCKGLEARGEDTPESHYLNCGKSEKSDDTLPGCSQQILICRDPEFAYGKDEVTYEQTFFVRHYYETYDVSHGVWHLLSAVFLSKFTFLVLSDNDDDDMREKMICFVCVSLFCAASYFTCLSYELEYDQKIAFLLCQAAIFLILPFSTVYSAILLRLLPSPPRCDMCEKDLFP